MSPRVRRDLEPVFDSPPGPVVVRIVFERFPVTIKGAFVLRGGDADPHVARIVGAEVARTPKGQARPIPVDTAAMDVAPRRDLFLPFEATIADLDPAWYVARCGLQVDGASPLPVDSRPFSVPWPRGTMATGSFSPGEGLSGAGGTIAIDRVDLRTDRLEVLWRAEHWAGDGPRLGASADGQELEPLPPSAGGADPGQDRRRSVWYPVPKGSRAVHIELGARGGAEGRLTVPIA
jgi:hypothetical protein